MVSFANILHNLGAMCRRDGYQSDSERKNFFYGYIYHTFQLKNSFVRIIDYVIFRSLDIFLIKIDHSS